MCASTGTPLLPIYTVQLCRMRYAYDTSNVWCKSNLQLACGCRVRHQESRGLLKHVSKPYDKRGDRQFYILVIVYMYYFHDKSSARYKNRMR